VATLTKIKVVRTYAYCNIALKKPPRDSFTQTSHSVNSQGDSGEGALDHPSWCGWSRCDMGSGPAMACTIAVYYCCCRCKHASMQACILKMCSVLSLGGVVDILQSGRQPWQRLNTYRAKRTPSPGLPPEAKSVGRNARVTMLLGRHVAYGQRRNCGGAHWVLRPPQLPLSESLRR
jgi:hypothetical protein